jgi:hypothetical protein
MESGCGVVMAGGGDWTGRRMRCRDAVDSVDRRREGEDEGRGIATFANGVQIRSEAQRRRQTQAKPAANALLDKLLIAALFAPLTCPVTVALAPAAARRPPGARRDETTTLLPLLLLVSMYRT